MDRTTPEPSADLPGGRSGPLGDSARVVHCPLDSPMTLGGTNTWVLARSGAPDVAVIDPGPDDEDHLRAVLDAVGGRRVAVTLLTHHHWDHAAGAERFAALTGAPVRVAAPAPGGPGASGAGVTRDLTDGEVVVAGGLDLHVVRTPGHTSDSTCLAVPGPGLLLTGDTVLGSGTTVLDHPDGRLGDYLGSLRRLADVVAEHRLDWLAPGHGPVNRDPGAVLTGYQRHREERLTQVRAALASLDVRLGDLPTDLTPLAGAVVDRVYTDTAPGVRPAAVRSVLAQLEYLRESPG